MTSCMILEGEEGKPRQGLQALAMNDDLWD